MISSFYLSGHSSEFHSQTQKYDDLVQHNKQYHKYRSEAFIWIKYTVALEDFIPDFNVKTILNIFCLEANVMKNCH